MPTPEAMALALVTAFRGRRTAGAFSCMSRKDVAEGLEERIKDPGKINQLHSSLCGPAALLYSTAVSSPQKYAQFVIDLYERGRAKLGKLNIRPGSDVRRSALPKGMAPVDWMTLASIRDSQNWFFDYQKASNMVAGITIPGALAGWFKKAGYRHVVNEANMVLTKGLGNVSAANQYFHRKYKVCLLINANMIQGRPDEKSLLPDHWVVLASGISVLPDSVRFTIFTWGNAGWDVPPPGRKLSRESFLDNYYGFVACSL
jgi:hypothetical protein